MAAPAGPDGRASERVAAREAERTGVPGRPAGARKRARRRGEGESVGRAGDGPPCERADSERRPCG